jgi:hypothetical protein
VNGLLGMLHVEYVERGRVCAFLLAVIRGLQHAVGGGKEKLKIWPRIYAFISTQNIWPRRDVPYSIIASKLFSPRKLAPAARLICGGNCSGSLLGYLISRLRDIS